MSDFWEGKRVVVAGGAGMIGSHVVELLVELGVAHIIAVDDLSTGTFENLHSFLGDCTGRGHLPWVRSWEKLSAQVDLVALDLTGPPVVETCAWSEPHIVINLASPAWGLGAAEHGQHAENLKDTLQIHFNLWDACRATPSVQYYLVAGSSCAAWGNETPEGEHIGYGWAKRMIWEHMNLAECYTTGTHFTSVYLQLYNIYGPRENPCLGRAVQALIRRVLKAGPGDPIEVWGLPHQRRNYLYVADCAQAILDTVEGGCSGILGIGGVNLSIKALAEHILEATGADNPLHFPMQGTCGMQDKTPLLDEQVKTPITEGLKKTVEWVKDEMEYEKLG